MSNCIDCNKCPQENCKGCETSIDATCVMLTDSIVCVQGKFFIESGQSIQSALKQMVCRIIDLENRVLYMEQNCCSAPPSCPIITIKTIK